MIRIFIACCLSAAAWAAPAASPPCRAHGESGPARQVSLLELYTSEGCSSCPPAERWLSALPPAFVDGRQALALAFHVDYWDGLGWRDRFASAAYSERQRRHAAQAGGAVVYTPQFLLNGRDWRPGGDGELAQALPQSASGATLQLDSRTFADGVDVTLRAQTPVKTGQRLMLALFENGLQSWVEAGENRGSLLRHDAVVRGLWGPFALDGGGHAALSRHLAFAAGQRPEFSGVAAWLEDVDSGAVSQAVVAACRR
ncbi:DUF1223 domain-containing protein [Chromobacterium subtsugae]|uniref:DUF1223 domain-containing protein n=1 Tax=Chromobacterium subtsugae TaxID=251747 RepID=A0ABS7FD90_9NEIS|nr:MULTISPECIES: DUF1223 domain-containing protein [Chromobacterium]KUM04895.1 hypothetical protein Cv017_11690 [Chromobacterium subtsugae]KZE86989.1 hypothetical protein AWB61_14700 [Chromobacterium sp. F49]MBW7566744.1 DUF1223 domain-containing protein [Chromobacterium subtsugae]MBW8288049.1 DUF1223 domain-containing protein [Chromobacterium subtsugae]OBU86476.1 hypothetical protein MY55_09830 [Chromobacterium subtsugae]